MVERRFLAGREACPFLPSVDGLWTARMMAPHRGRHDVPCYEAALGFAQSLWLEGKPAQALLQLNKAMMADLSGAAGAPEDAEERRSTWALPYAAKRWVIRMAQEDEFIGNPVRHYQHLATRMRGPRPELRTWRAWACFHLAEHIVSPEEHPRDERQIAQEAVVVPEWGEVAEHLERLGLVGESGMVEALFLEP